MKRFTATEKWDKEWFRGLKPRLKCLWQFICDRADPCGAWEPDFGLAAFQIGERVSSADLAAFGDRLHKLPNGKFLVVSFIEFQYGKLSDACPAHKPVFRAMEKNRVTSSLLNTLRTGQAGSLQEEEEDKEEETEEEVLGSAEGPFKPNKLSGFSDFWQAYPLKVGKPKAEAAWKAHGCAEHAPQILTAIRQQKISDQWTRDGGTYIPHPTTWLNRCGWEDQLPASLPQKTPHGRTNADQRTAADRERDRTGIEAAPIPTPTF